MPRLVQPCWSIQGIAHSTARPSRSTVRCSWLAPLPCSQFLIFPGIPKPALRCHGYTTYPPRGGDMRTCLDNSKEDMNGKITQVKVVPIEDQRLMLLLHQRELDIHFIVKYTREQ